MHTKDPARQLRSLRTCHLPAEQKPLAPVRDNRTYVPELAARLDTDPNLTDGARRCARILAAYTYRRHRDTRTAQITVTYSRSFAIRFQNRVDELRGQSHLHMRPLRLLPPRWYRALDRLPHHPPVHPQLPRHTLNRAYPKLILQPNLLE
jgi:hypothetical protein